MQKNIHLSDEFLICANMSFSYCYPTELLWESLGNYEVAFALLKKMF